MTNTESSPLFSDVAALAGGEILAGRESRGPVLRLESAAPIAGVGMARVVFADGSALPLPLYARVALA